MTTSGPRHLHPGHGHGGEGGFDPHRNPEDFAAYLSKLEGDDRAAWQKPDEVIAALGLVPGAVACDAGAGPGYFALRLARAVGPSGRVHALDVEPRMLALLEERARAAGVKNVTPALADGGAPLPPEPCDLILVVNTYHHFRDGPATLRRLATRLRPGGRIVNIDFHPGELPVGPPPEHKLSREAFLADADRAGLALVGESTFLPYQYFVALAPR
jgi:ubiquinone/menaquinone biosynthesis C-methylase UbiE